MLTAGLIGGIGPESTIEYYRRIIESYRERVRDGSYPRIILNSIDLKRLLDLVEAGRLPALTNLLLEELNGLHRAGAHFGALAANAPHIVFDDLRRQSPIPLISIVEASCQAATAGGMRCVGLFGIRFTMRARFYSEVFNKAGISVVVPSSEEQDYIHDKYVNELIHGKIRQETRDGLLAIAERLKVLEGVQGVILGGTELSLILGETTEAGIPFLDTTRLHVEQIVARMLSGGGSTER